MNINKWVKIISSVVLFAIVVFGIPPKIYSAAPSGPTGTVTVDCTSFTQAGWGGYSFVADRDNTATGQERFDLTVTDGSGNNVYTFTFSTTLGTTNYIFDGTFTYSGTPVSNPLSYKVASVAGNGFGEQVLVTATGNCSLVASPDTTIVIPARCPVFFDGRINSCDTHTSVVLYGQPDDNDNWRLDVYNADESGLLLVIPAETIAAVPECPESNTLIHSDAATGISLWRLTERPNGTCPFQLNAPATEPGKTYVVIFDTLYPNTYYESWDEWLGQ